MNFFVNKAMGIGNSGVEHAQFYRAKCFDLAGIPYKYVFTEFVKNMHDAMAAWNLRDEQVINMWELFVFGEDYLTKGAAAKYKHEETILLDHTNTHRSKKTITACGLLVMEHLEKSPSKKKENMLLVSDYQVEIYDYETMEKKIMYKLVHHPRRGRLIQNIHLFDFDGEHRYFQTEVQLQRYFFHYLTDKFPGQANFFLDRGQETESALYHHRPAGAKLIELIHADHLSDRDEPSAPLWNNYYEYLFTHIDKVDKVVVATKLQREDLLIDFPEGAELFAAIPVGGIRDQNEDAEAASDRPITKFITASRLASEKHLDIVIKAIHRAREVHPELTLDIFGQGGEDVKLKKVIAELGAEDYVKLRGHSHDIQNEYKQFDAFISGSYSEGFGLTYIEALDEGLPIVTYRARFGAMELVQEGVNGVLKDFSRTDEEYSIQQLTDGIFELLNADPAELRKNTRRSVADFQDSIIAEKWRVLLDEV